MLVITVSQIVTLLFLGMFGSETRASDHESVGGRLNAMSMGDVDKELRHLRRKIVLYDMRSSLNRSLLTGDFNILSSDYNRIISQRDRRSSDVLERYYLAWLKLRRHDFSAAAPLIRRLANEAQAEGSLHEEIIELQCWYQLRVAFVRTHVFDANTTESGRQVFNAFSIDGTLLEQDEDRRGAIELAWRLASEWQPSSVAHRFNRNYLLWTIRRRMTWADGQANNQEDSVKKDRSPLTDLQQAVIQSAVQLLADNPGLFEVAVPRLQAFILSVPGAENALTEQGSAELVRALNVWRAIARRSAIGGHAVDRLQTYLMTALSGRAVFPPSVRRVDMEPGTVQIALHDRGRAEMGVKALSFGLAQAGASISLTEEDIDNAISDDELNMTLAYGPFLGTESCYGIIPVGSSAMTGGFRVVEPDVSAMVLSTVLESAGFSITDPLQIHTTYADFEVGLVHVNMDIETVRAFDTLMTRFDAWGDLERGSLSFLRTEGGHWIVEVVAVRKPSARFAR